MIVQELHKIQHKWGYLPRAELQLLTERLNTGKSDRREETKLYQLHQIASFFPHFRLEPPPAVDLRVCRDMACFMHVRRNVAPSSKRWLAKSEGNMLWLGEYRASGSATARWP